MQHTKYYKYYFYYRTNKRKVNDQIFQIIQKTLFLAYFPYFWGKMFSKRSGTSYGFVTPCQKLKKTNNPIPRKRLYREMYRQTDGRMDRPYFIEPCWLPPRDQQILNISILKPYVRYSHAIRFHFQKMVNFC